VPLLASAVMFFISLFQLHAFCKICVGIYFSSFLLAVAGVLALVLVTEGVHQRPDAPDPVETLRSVGFVAPVLILIGFGIASLLPAMVYASALPDYRPFLEKCGKLVVQAEAHNALLKIPTKHPVQPAILFEDPLCPTCKAFHARLLGEGIFENLDVTM